MTAATVDEQQTTLPEPDEATQQAAEKDLPRPGLPGIDPARELEPSADFKRRIAAMAQAIPYHEGDDDEPATDLAELRTRTYATAWRNSVKAARLEDRMKWTLDAIAADQALTPDQKAATMQNVSALHAYVQQIGPKAKILNLVLGGRVGAGKTSAAIAAGNEAAARGLMVRIVKHKHYLDWLRPNGAPGDLTPWQVRARFRDCDLLIVDDLGAELDEDREASRFVREETLGLVGDRIEAGKATIFTTNEKPEVRGDNGALVGGLALTLGERLLSRISERGHALTFAGPDRRGRLSW